MTHPDPVGRLVFTRHVTQPRLRAALRDGTLVRLRRGAYATPRMTSEPRHEASQRYARATIKAVSQQLTSTHYFSHESAALIWELPLWRVPGAVHVIQRHVPGGSRLEGLVRHRNRLDPADRDHHGGHPVTSLERTVVDCVRTLPAGEGLVVADAALRQGVAHEALLDRVAREEGRGVVRARAVLAVADAGAESPAESMTRHIILRHGLPTPRTQVPVRTRLGTFRSDIGWEEWRVLVEFDGFVKYSAFADGDAARVLFEEKRRQEAIEEEGWRVLRVTAADLRDGAALAARIRRVLPSGVSRSRQNRRDLT